MRIIHRGLVWVLALALVPAAEAEEAPPPSWREQAESAGLTAPVVERLARDGFAITDTTYRQSFEPYMEGRLPRFITADTLLHAANVLIEESLAGVEYAEASRLDLVLEQLWAGIDPKTADVGLSVDDLAAAQGKLRWVLGTALGLWGAPLPPETEAEARRIAEEVARIESAEEGAPVPWSLPDVLLDYGDFRPRGLYDGTARLRRYYRVVRLLQSVPFVLSDDRDFAALVLLAAHLGSDKSRKWTDVDRCRSFLRDPELAPPAVTRTLYELSWDVGDDALALPLEELRDEVLQDWAREHGQVARASEVALQIFPSSRLPDARLLESRRADEAGFGIGRIGLAIGALLGSTEAGRHLGPEERDIVDAQGAGPKAGAHGVDLYTAFLSCLGSLVEEAEPDAPALFRSGAWRRRALQSALSGWAAMRQALLLHVEPVSMTVGGVVELPSGLVEPVPEFYAGMAFFCLRAEDVLDGAFHEQAARARLAAVMEPLFVPHGGPFTEADRAQALEFARSMGRSLDLPANSMSEADLVRELQSAYERLVSRESLDKKLESYVERTVPSNLRNDWHTLRSACRQLEVLAHKQLRGVPFSAAQDAWIRDYWKELSGWLQAYDAMNPDDDAPRIGDVRTRWPASGEPPRHDLVGTGRPQALYVLYPWRGAVVLCQGAVTPYVEFESTTRMTNGEWLHELGTGAVQRRHLPEWLEGAYAREGR